MKGWVHTWPWPAHVEMTQFVANTPARSAAPSVLSDDHLPPLLWQLFHKGPGKINLITSQESKDYIS